jgi:hypothetical protein
MAGTVTAVLNSVAPSGTLHYSLDGGSTFQQTLAGKINWSRTGGTHVGAPAGDFVTFCIELTEHVSLGGSYAFDVVDLASAPDPGGWGVGLGMGTAKADLLRELWGRHYASVADSTTAAAFQVAVWEIVYDDGLALGGGSFQVKFPDGPVPAYLSTAQSWLGSLDGSGPAASLYALSRAGVQDQVFEVAHVPLPLAAWSGLGLLGLVAVRRYRGRRGG